MRRALTAALLFLLPAAAHAEPRLGQLFTDHAVLQRGRPIAIWGSAAPAERISVSLGDAARDVTANRDGRWRVELPAMAAGGPWTLTATSSSGTAKADDILIGDVWLCSGQSNMELPVSRSLVGDEPADPSKLRLLTIAKRTAVDPRAEFETAPAWQPLTAEAVAGFSAACYFMAARLQRTQNVPIGAINDSWGGTQIRAWQDRAAAGTTGGADAELLALYRRDPAAANARFGERWANWWREHNARVATPWTGGDAGLAWATVPKIDYWECWGDPHFATFNGTVWMRTRFTLTLDEAKQRGTLSLGVIDELDQSFVNGIGVGSTYSWEQPRNYRIAPGVLHAGDNTVVVNVFDGSGNGGLAGPADAVHLTLADGTVKPLGNGWQYAVQTADLGAAPRAPWDNAAGLSQIYNGMIAPLHDYGLTGVAWYQGESDVLEPGSYADRLTAMMAGWRRQFARPDLPFLIVSLANYGPSATQPVPSAWAALREEQRIAAARDPHAALVIAMDLGERLDIHPANKPELGRRLARGARALAYGGSDPVGPAARRVHRSEGEILVDFAGVTGSLQTWSGTTALAFELCGDTQQSCRYASATADGRTVRIADDGRAATRVRYAWADTPVTNLYDEAPLPVGPFELPIAP